MPTSYPLSRRRFLHQTGLAAASLLTARVNATAPAGPALRPRCLTMWDFSWLERRWPGAGYEDWPRILDELVERGYDAVRIDAFPHLVATAPEKKWTLVPVWHVFDWGSPVVNVVQVQPALNEFIALCHERGVKVGLSSWYRQDTDDTRLHITSADIMAEQWNRTLAGIRDAGLLDAILYVDLCNEWPGDLWAPYFRNDPPKLTWGGWHTATSLAWMKTSCAAVRREFPGLPVGYSFEPKDVTKLDGLDLGFLDYAEPHLWLAQANGNEFARTAGYQDDRFSIEGFATLAKAGPHYRADPAHWQAVLREHIEKTARAFAPHAMPLMTSECWGVVNYKDWPLLEWDWLKEVCRFGVDTAAATGQWLAIATSNFAGPQFVGMWRDVAWHQQANAVIKRAPIRPELQSSLLARRLT